MWWCPLHRMFRGVNVEVAVTEEIDITAGRVLLRRRRTGETVTLAYGQVVLALGSVTDFRAGPGMAQHAIGLRTLGDAIYLRNRARWLCWKRPISRKTRTPGDSSQRSWCWEAAPPASRSPRSSMLSYEPPPGRCGLHDFVLPARLTPISPYAGLVRRAGPRPEPRILAQLPREFGVEAAGTEHASTQSKRTTGVDHG